MDILLVLTTLPDRAQAEALGTALVDARHAACATVLPGARSIYRWQGVVETADEALLLGTGGLVRAYSGAVKEGIAASKIGTMRYGVRLKIYTDYNGIGRIQYILRQNGLEAEDTVYTDQVELTVLLAAECVPGLKKEITEATAAKAGIEEVEKLYFVAPDA